MANLTCTNQSNQEKIMIHQSVTKSSNFYAQDHNLWLEQTAYFSSISCGVKSFSVNLRSHPLNFPKVSLFV